MDDGRNTELTLDKAHQGIRRLERLEADGATIDELVSAIKELHVGAKVELPVMPEGARLFRAREIGKPPLVQSEISYPPAGLLTKYGRANTPGEPIFYSCWGTDAYSDQNNMIGCLWEARAQEGKLYALSEWQTMEPLPLYPFGYRAASFLKDPSRVGTPRTKQDWITSATPAEPMAAIQEWASNVFTREVQDGSEQLYLLSAALAKYALELRFAGGEGEWEKVAGIVYPSVATYLSIDNICLRPTVVDAAVCLLGVRIVSVANMHFLDDSETRPSQDAVANAEVTFYENSIRGTEDGEIRWPKNWIKRSIFDQK